MIALTPLSYEPIIWSRTKNKYCVYLHNMINYRQGGMHNDNLQKPLSPDGTLHERSHLTFTTPAKVFSPAKSCKKPYWKRKSRSSHMTSSPMNPSAAPIQQRAEKIASPAAASEAMPPPAGSRGAEKIRSRR